MPFHGLYISMSAFGGYGEAQGFHEQHAPKGWKNPWPSPWLEAELLSEQRYGQVGVLPKLIQQFPHCYGAMSSQYHRLSPWSKKWCIYDAMTVLRHVKELENQLKKMDEEYDKCNMVSAQGELNGLDAKYLWCKFHKLKLLYVHTGVSSESDVLHM